MADLIPHDIPVHPPEHPEDHEQSDVPVNKLALTLGILTAVLLITFGLVYVMFQAFDRYQTSLDVKLTNVDAKADVPIDRPQLQGVQGFNDISAAEETAAMMSDVKKRLSSEGQLPDGRHHIRIDRAMQMVVESGQLKVSTQPATQPRSAATQSTTRGSNAGR